MAIAHVLLRENHGHEEFLKQWVVGLEDFQSLCREYSPEIAENVSGVKKENILEAARVLAK